MSYKDLSKKLNIPEKYSFPYIPEKFSAKEKKILDNFFTNTDKPVFAIYNLPQEVVGAMFSRYSRSEKSVRRLFLDEFWNSSFSIYKVDNKRLNKARERTDAFYKRVFAEYGDDSVIQMGSVHVAFEFLSQMIGAKAVEDARIGASYIEKSTRYVDFGKKISKRYLFMDPVEITKSKYKKEFVDWNNALFEAYAKNIPITANFLRSKYKLEEIKVENSKDGKLYKYKDLDDEKKEMIKSAYERAIKAKSFDTIRYFLPLTTVTNLGAHYSGQATEVTINKMLVSPFSEVRKLGLLAYEELIKVSPNFLQNIDSDHGDIYRKYRENIRLGMEKESYKCCGKLGKGTKSKSISLVDYDKNGLEKICADIIYSGQTVTNYSKKEINSWIKKHLNQEKMKDILKSAIPDRTNKLLNRRHKLPRSFENVFAEVEFYVDCGVYKDLQRNRVSTTQRISYQADDIEIPKEYFEKGMEEVLNDYKKLSEWTNKLHKKILLCKNSNLSRASEYITILGNKVRFSIKANIRQWIYFSELRTISGGHPAYRFAMQEAVREIINKMFYLKPFFAKVDWTPDYGLGRFTAELKTQEKLSKLKNK
jgi:thymidylate synthase ThyX